MGSARHSSSSSLHRRYLSAPRPALCTASATAPLGRHSLCSPDQQGELALASKRLGEQPSALAWLISAVSLAYGGTYAFTAAIQGFGAVVATGLGICRKFVSVCFSFLLFPKPFGLQQARPAPRAAQPRSTHPSASARPASTAQPSRPRRVATV